MFLNVRKLEAVCAFSDIVIIEIFIATPKNYSFLAPRCSAPAERKAPAERSRNSHRCARAPSVAPLREQHCCKNEDDNNEDA